MLGGVLHAFFRLFWPMSLLSSRWACEFEPQVLAWVGCSKPSCFTRFGAGSGCGGLAGERAWGALGASPGALGGLWALWGPLGGGVWELLGALWGPRSLGGPPGPPSETPKEVLEGFWGPLGASGGRCGSLGASGGRCGSLGASGGRWGHDRYPRAPRGTKNKQTNKQTTNKGIHKQTSKQTNEQTNKRANKQTSKQTSLQHSG